MHTNPSVSTERLLRLPDVEAMTGLRRSALYAAMKEGKFPPCVKLGARAAAWPESEVQAGFPPASVRREGAPNERRPA
ncbi:helix-turn-helix transcriptional regulator [Thiomonas intermedia]|uniref:helix-turn-helix transcriptional regulator n=1 Tax=Thiomonas intermedia TaxID=926 RepID=UPI0009A5032D|nr:AlpA family phage regulatory protein [Thiomonas intermedia]